MSPENSSFHNLTTKRIVLRELEEDDAREIFNLRSNDQVNQYLDREPARTMDDAINFISKIRAMVQKKEGYYFALCLKENPRLVGTISFFNLSKSSGTAEMGYELLPFYHGKGIMHEAMSIAIYFAFHVMQWSKIVACPSQQNAPSIKLLKRNGFKQEEETGEQDAELLRFVLHKDQQVN